MNWEVPVQPAGQAGAPGKTAGVGLEVGVLRSSKEAPVMGAERRRDTCPNVRSDRGRYQLCRPHGPSKGPGRALDGAASGLTGIAPWAAGNRRRQRIGAG